MVAGELSAPVLSISVFISADSDEPEAAFQLEGSEPTLELFEGAIVVCWLDGVCDSGYAWSRQRGGGT